MELKEPQDYYPIPEEPEGELIDYDAISKTYKTGDKQYTTVYGGYVGTYKNEDGDTELVDNTLVKPEEADTPASEEAQEASSVVATEEKEEKTEVYQNKANDYAILLPEQMSEENGVTIENGKTRIRIIPVDGIIHIPLLKTMRSFIMKFTRAQMFSIQYWIPALRKISYFSSQQTGKSMNTSCRFRGIRQK